jgi:hypothetical protein
MCMSHICVKCHYKDSRPVILKFEVEEFNIVNKYASICHHLFVSCLECLDFFCTPKLYYSKHHQQYHPCDDDV